MPRACYDPCDNGLSVELDTGATVVHVGPFHYAATWAFRLAFFESNPDGSPNLDAPLDLTGSTWTVPVWPVGATDPLPPWASFVVDDSQQNLGFIDLRLDPDDRPDGVAIAPNCDPSYVYEVRQDRGGAVAYPVIGTIAVQDPRQKFRNL